MKDEQLFIDKFNEIKQETMKDYPPEEREIVDLHRLFDDIILSWDTDIRDHGIDYQIAYFRKNADKTDKALTKQKAILQPGAIIKTGKKGQPLAPINTPQSTRISNAFFLSALLKMDRFIIEYLEGSKGKPIEAPENNSKPALTAEQVALITIYKRIEVPREAADQIAMDYKSGSGYNLYITRGKLSHHADRLAVESKTKGRGKIKRIESIMGYLSPDEQKRAKDEVKILQDTIDKL